MPGDVLRIGLIGGGSIVRQRHMPGLSEIEGVEVLAVCNRTYNSTRQFAEDFKIERVVHDWEEIIGMDDIDIVWIGTTPYMHCPIMLKAIEADKHVFCQARMCMNLDEARQMLAAGQAHPKSVVRFCPPPMGMGCDRTMRRLLNEERFVGDVRQVSLISATGALLDPEAPLTWRLQTEQSGQNVLTLGIYYEVLERWLGPTRRITAVTANWTPTRKHPNSGELKPSDLPESVNIIAELESGAIGTYIFNGVSSHAPTDHLAIHGTEGSLVYDFNGDIAQERIEGAKLGRESMDTIPIPDSERGNWTVEADFIHEIRHGEARGLLPGLQRAYNYMALIDATHRSAANNRGVEV